MESDLLTFPLYEKAKRRGILDGKNALIIAPTASGKSYIGRDIIHKALIKGQNGLIHAYLVPYRALAAEVYDDFLDLFSHADIKIRLLTGDHRDAVHPEKADLVIATYESFAGLLRNADIHPGFVVADEVHLINDPHRGPVVEGLFARLKTRRPQGLCALSAVIENPEELAGWLEVDLLKGTEEDRPVPLTISCEFTEDRLEQLSTVLKSCTNGSQALVFCNSRRGAEKTARDLQENLNIPGDESRQHELAGRIREENPGLTELKNLVLSGFGFHHAGLTKNVRRLLEKAFREGYLKILTCTPTLAAGVNLPAEIAVVRDIYRADTVRGQIRQTLISSGELLNMLGRAGRPHQSVSGKGIALISSDHENDKNIQGLKTALEEGHGGKVQSHLSDSFEAIMRFVLAVIADHGETTLDDIADVYVNTFSHYLAGDEISFDRSFEEDIMEDIPSFQKVKKAGGSIFMKNHNLLPDGVKAGIVSRKPDGKENSYEVTIKLTGVECTCPAAKRWHRHEVCKHAACAIHSLIFGENIDAEARARTIYNCGHVFAGTLNSGTKLAKAVEILEMWHLLEKVPGAWQVTPIGEIAVQTYFDLLLVREVQKQVAESEEADYRTVVQWVVENYFADEKVRPRWHQAIKGWLNEVSIDKIPMPTGYRGDFENQREELAQVCRLYEKAARTLGKEELEQAAMDASKAIHYGVAPEVAPLLALNLAQLGRARARHLYDAGIHDVSDLAEANEKHIAGLCRVSGTIAQNWISRAQEIHNTKNVRSDILSTSDPSIDDLLSRFNIDPVALIS